jgi:hypothetical protein
MMSHAVNKKAFSNGSKILFTNKQNSGASETF